MKKLILVILFLPSLVSAQWSGTWVSGGGGDTTGIVHNAIKIRGIPVTLIAPSDNQILKFDTALDSLMFEADASVASGTDSVFISVTTHDADTDTLFIKPSGFSGTNTFAAGTRVLVYKDAATELFGIDSLGALVAGSISTSFGAIDVGASAIAGSSFDASDGNIANVGQLDVDTIIGDGATLVLGDNSETIQVNSSDWDISTTGAMTNFSFDANGTGNAITNLEDADHANDALDADKIVGDSTDDDDLDVAAGGTGVSTLTDGGPLLGSGTGDITAMAVLANGEFIVGDGTTDPVAESGATLRTSVGVGTGDSPTFTGLTLTGTLALNGDLITSDGVLVINATSATSFNDENITNVGQLDVDTIIGDGATLVLGDNSETIQVNSSDWDISTTGAITGIALDANGTGNSITNLEDADHANDALDADKIVGDTTDDDDLDVAAGGTGVSTLTDGGMLFGSGTGDITALGVATNGQIAIGDGTTDPVLATITAGNRIQVTNGGGTITIASADTGEIQLPAALWDTTASSNGTLDFLETGAYRVKYWEYAASTQDTLLMTCDVNFTIPQDFSSWIDVKFEYENESTGADTLIMRMEGIAHDEAHAADLVIGSAADTLVSATGPAANDLRQGTAQTTITGTFAPEDHVHLLLYRPATDAGVMRFLKLTFRYLKS